MTDAAVENGLKQPVGRLRFSDEEAETKFHDYYFEQSLPFTRLAIVLALVLYALFGILDLFIVPEVASEIWVIRYAIFCPIALLVLTLTFTRWFKPRMQATLSVLAVMCGLGIVAMVAIADSSGGYLYYAGLLLVIPWAYSVLRLRFWYATAAAAIIVAGYEVVAILLKDTPPEFLVNNNFFFLSSTIIGMVAGYTIERGIRTDFLQRRLIETQREKLAEHNVRLDSELQKTLDEVRRQAREIQASRARIVAAADGERRRIERNLHDGAQQHLMALGVRLRLVSKLAEKDPPAVGELVEGLREQVQNTIDEVRNLAHGIYPPLLMDKGLTAALEAAAARAVRPTSVEAASLRRYPTEVEATVYFCCLEAVQNSSKYGGETCRVTVRVREMGGALEFEVVDDGAGFDTSTGGRGAGFVNMSDRLGALGGSVHVESSPGQGTKVSGTIPLPDEAQDAVKVQPSEADTSQHGNDRVLSET